MLFRRLYYTLFLIGLSALTSCDQQNNSQEKAIKENTVAYQQAFNTKDVNALAALWAENGNYVIPETGEVVEGKNAISERFASFFKNRPDSKIEVKTQSISFPSSNEAVEVATSTIKQGDEILAHTAYRSFYEKQNGKWLITEIREVPTLAPPQASEHLKELEWLIGSWIDEDEDTDITSQYQWDRYKNFIIQTFSVTNEGSFSLEGKQIIGWDPINEKIRSWIFDSDGSFGEGSWKKQGDNWVEEVSSTLTDGRKASSINIFTPVDQNKYTWQSTGRSVGAKILPDIDPVTVVRSKN